MQNETSVLIALVAGLALALALVAIIWRVRAKQRTAALREHFGAEYDRVLSEHKNRGRAERELALRHKRVQKLHIQPLSAEQCARFGSDWSDVQQRFVDDPTAAVGDAARLVKEVMSARGYPTGDFEQRVADLSVEHANVIDHYRAARTLAQASERGEASTEDLRQAMVHYRALFTDLLQVQAHYAGQLRPAHA